MNKSIKKIKKAVILAGGLGTRFLPATLALAKELFPICEKPILMYHIEDLIKAGITEVLIIGNKLKEDSFNSFINPSNEYLDKIKKDNKLSFLDSYNSLKSSLNDLSYINQEIGSDYLRQHKNLDVEQRGSSIAILACKDWVKDEPFLVFNGDDFLEYPSGESVSKSLVDLYAETGDNIVFGREVNLDDIYKYSSISLAEKLKVKNSYKIHDIIEKPKKEEAPSNIMGFARYVFNSEIFDKILNSSPRANGEYCITDVISELAKENKVSTYIFDGHYFDCGSKLGLQMAGNYLLMKDSNNRKLLIDEFERILKSFNEK